MNIPDTSGPMPGWSPIDGGVPDETLAQLNAQYVARIADLEAKLAESERLAGVLREQRNKAEDELRGRA